MLSRSFRNGLNAQRRSPRWAVVVALLLLVGGFASRPAPAATPSDALRERLQHNGDINDFAKVLTPADKAALAERCRALREKTGAGFVVVVIDSLEGGQIDEFANKLFKQWGIGQKGKDNGLLLLVSMRDHKARLEVGYGLEPIIPDALAGRILDEQLFPAFKQQRYAEGLKAAVNRAAELVERGEPAPPEARHKGRPPVPVPQQILMTAFLALFVLIGSFLLGAGIGAKAGPLGLFGAFFCGVPFFMGLVAAAPLAPIVHTPLGLLFIWLGLRVGRKHPGSFRGNRTGGGSSASPWSAWDWQSFGNASSGSSWSGGGFSSDAGSFGGGCSGGGGASGSW